MSGPFIGRIGGRLERRIEHATNAGRGVGSPAEETKHATSIEYSVPLGGSPPPALCYAAERTQQGGHVLCRGLTGVRAHTTLTTTHHQHPPLPKPIPDEHFF